MNSLSSSLSRTAPERGKWLSVVAVARQIGHLLDEEADDSQEAMHSRSKG